MSSNLFEIENLSCKYSSSFYPVLEINELNIPSSAITFFIGASGVGKSTVLETLGLMNNTLASNGNSKFNFNALNDTFDLLDIWAKREGEIAEFRKKHLSFIFQTTNLFSTLSAYENVILTMLLQGKSKNDAVKITKNIFENIFINELKKDKKITELSGGQRQRLAFARAIAVDYTVLFADEPTGNLDFANAHKLMELLVENIDKKNNKSAIIVSHDIYMAANFADKIVLIDKKYNEKDKYTYGSISEKNNYIKHDSIWHSSNGAKYSLIEMVSHLNSKLKEQVING